MVIYLLRLLLRERDASDINCFAAYDGVVGDFKRIDLEKGEHRDVDPELIIA
jgi:hypothetical protein